MIASIGTTLDRLPDLRHRVRRLKEFRKSFEKVADEVGTRYGQVFAVDERRLTSAFLNWAEAFARDRGNSSSDRRDFTIFMGGVMLKQLIHAGPVTVTQSKTPTTAIPPDILTSIVEFWPEGFCYVYFCLTIVSSILEGDFEEIARVSPYFEDLRVWQSFRENIREDPALAIPYFDLLISQRPNWTLPESWFARPRSVERVPIAQISN